MKKTNRQKFPRFKLTLITVLLGLGITALGLQALTSAKNAVFFQLNHSGERDFYPTPTPKPTANPAPTATPVDPIDPPQINPNGVFGTSDVDCDGIENDRDNCLFTYNPGQEDRNKNGIGDICEPDPRNPKVFFLGCDKDGDGIFDQRDNCPLVCNPDQKDTNENGIGDVCDPALPGAILGEKFCRKRKKIKRVRLPDKKVSN